MPMTSTPSIGRSAITRLRRSSAGGQLEHPSDVNTSARTGTRGLPGAPIDAIRRREQAKTASMM
jgi:hypothetical protein